MQYRCISSPPCSTTTEPACTAPFFLSLSHRRCLFRANSASGTFRVSFPREKEGLQRHEHRPVSSSPQRDSGQLVVSRPVLNLLGPRDNPSLSQSRLQRLVYHTLRPSAPEHLAYLGMRGDCTCSGGRRARLMWESLCRGDSTHVPPSRACHLLWIFKNRWES